MSEQDLTLTDAIQIAMEAEKQAVALYKDAVQKELHWIVQKLPLKSATQVPLLWSVHAYQHMAAALLVY